MTRKHFAHLAGALYNQKPVLGNSEEIDKARSAQWHQDVYAIASTCARFNPNFDQERFMVACITGKGAK